MQKKAALITITASVLYLLLSTAKAMAISISDFPVCSNPQGSVIASYESGTHGIVGNQGEYTGKDIVYQVDDNKVVQCFCPDSGNGIQTSWFKTAGLTEDEINIYKANGWILVPNGALWGLDEGSYLAKNIDFACKGTSNGSSGGTGGSSNGVSSGIVNSSSAVLGLAGTGNSLTLFGLMTTSILAFVLSFVLRRSK